MNEQPIQKILILAANPIDSVRLSLDREVGEKFRVLSLHPPATQVRANAIKSTQVDYL